MYDLNDSTIRYEYPNDLDLHPNGMLHQNLLAMLQDYVSKAEDEIGKKKPYWDEIDKHLTVYIKLDKRERKSKVRDPRRPVSIVFPYSYAVMESLIAYCLNVFIKVPIFTYSGVGPEDIPKAKILSELVNYQLRKTQITTKLHTALRDCIAFGVCPTGVGWTTKRKPNGTLIFEGTELINIDPYMYLPDSECSVDNTDAGDFIGFHQKSSYYKLLELEAGKEAGYFNSLYARNYAYSFDSEFSMRKRVGQSYRYGTADLTNTVDIKNPQIKLTQLYVNLIPKEYDLSDVTYPQKWLFTLVNNLLIVRAQPTDLPYDGFPISVGAPESDGYSALPLSKLELIHGMHETANWLLNAHIRGAVNQVRNRYIVDPTKIMIKDLVSGSDIIRTQTIGFDQKVGNAIMQLPITDVTRSHLNDAEYLYGMISRVAGTSESAMGSLRKGGPERLTSAEYLGTAQGQNIRMDRMMILLSAQWLTNIAEKAALHAQTFQTQESYLRLTEGLAKELATVYNLDVNEERYLIDPNELDFPFDVVTDDFGRYSDNDLGTLTEFLPIMVGDQEYRQTHDIPGVIDYMLRENGIRQIDRFKRELGSAQAMPDEQIRQEQQAGNIVPIEEAI